MKKVLKSQVQQVIFSYQQLLSDYHACVGNQELQYWVNHTEDTIDRAVCNVLGGGFSKSADYLRSDLNSLYTKLQSYIIKANITLKS